MFLISVLSNIQKYLKITLEDLVFFRRSIRRLPVSSIARTPPIPYTALTPGNGTIFYKDILLYVFLSCRMLFLVNCRTWKNEIFGLSLDPWWFDGNKMREGKYWCVRGVLLLAKTLANNSLIAKIMETSWSKVRKHFSFEILISKYSFS